MCNSLRGVVVVMVVLLACGTAGAVVYNYDGQVIKLPDLDYPRPGEPRYTAFFQKMAYDIGQVPVKVVVPAQVGVEGTKGKLARWVNLAIPSVRLATMTRVAIEAGLMAGTYYLGEFLTDRAWQWYNGQICSTSAGSTYVLSEYATGYGPMSWYSPSIYKDLVIDSLHPYGTYLGSSTVSALALADGGWSAQKWACYNQGGSFDNPYHLKCKPGQAYQNYVTPQTVYTPVATSTIEAEIQEEMDRLDSADERMKAWEASLPVPEYLGPSVTEANEEWPGDVPNSTGYAPLTPTQGDAVQTAFNESIDPDVQQDMMEDANGTIAQYPDVPSDWEYTPEQMADAQYQKDLEREAAWMTDWNADKPSDGNGSSATAGTYTLPERKDLPGVLNTFKAGLNSLPIISWVNGVELEVTGASSVVTLPLPDVWGSSITVDFADYENILDLMGAGLYALVGMASVLFLFRGRGD